MDAHIDLWIIRKTAVLVQNVKVDDPSKLRFYICCASSY
jgi:hypothetical protein